MCSISAKYKVWKISIGSSTKWRVTVSRELMFLEIYGKCDVIITVTLLL